MPPKPFLFDLQCRNSFVCRSCLAAFRTKQPQALPRLYTKSALQRPSQPSGTRSQASRLIKPDEEQPKVRYFQQQEGGSVLPLSGSDAFSGQLNEMGADLELRLKELEEKLQDAAGLRKMLQKHGLHDEIDRLEKQLDLEEEDAEDDEQSLIPSIRETGLRNAQRRHIARLNSCLRNASRAVRKGLPSKKIISNTWKHYSLARPGLSLTWENVPKEAWDALWEVFSWEDESNPNRMAHTCALAKDMTAAGVQLNDARQLLAIEAMFIEGWRKEAVDNWKRVVVTVGSKPELFNEYWELGVRMCSLHGDLDRAERAADTLLNSSSGEADARVLIHLIRAYAATPDCGKKAWKFYRLLRERLGSSMQIEDYDEVISCFLATNQMEFALHTFVDMMFSGAIDMQGRTKLPSSVSNHFFLGKWLKRLIGAGDLDGAHNVLKFMQSKGIMAAAVQVNGLIGAWLRSSTAENLEKADKLAWAMIRSRLTFVKLRQREAALEWPLRLLEGGGSHNADTSELTFVPKATLETFSLMAENYRSRGLHGRLEELWVAFKESEIATDAFMMNQLIESHAEEARGEEARELYRMMTQDHHILPNSHTFFALFKTLAVNRVWWPSLTEDLKEQDRALCRQIFRDLLRSSWVFDDDGGMHEIQAKMVLHSFRKSGDYVGLLVALQALKQILHFPVSQIVVLEMIAENDDLHRPTPRAKEQILKARRTIEFIIAERRRAAPDRDENSFTPEENIDELYAVIAQYYRAKLQASDTEVQEMYHIVAQEMGVYESLSDKRPSNGYQEFI